MADAKSAPQSAATTTEAAPGSARPDPHQHQADRTRSRAGPGQDAGRGGAGRHRHLRPQPHADVRQGRSRRSTPRCPQQLTAIMHDPKFLKLEGTWRGLHYLVQNTETGTTLKLRVLNITKRELCRDLQPRDRVRPEPDLQEDLRERVRHARRRAVRRPDRRLRVHQPSRRHRDCCGRCPTSPPARSPVHLGGGAGMFGFDELDRAVQAARPGEDLRHGRVHQVASVPRQRGFALRDPRHAARARPPALRRRTPSRSTSSTTRKRRSMPAARRRRWITSTTAG